MATVVGLVTGGLSLAEIAARSSLSLIKLLESFHNHNKTILNLKQDLESLAGLLQQLNNAVIANPADSAALELPLRECCRACEDFTTLVTKCTTHFDEEKTSIRDWARVKIKENEIFALKGLINNYKSTISIALGCITLRTVRMTADGLQKWQGIIASTISKLEECLSKTDDRLQALSRYGAFISDADAAERNRLQAEKDTIKQCLIICAQGATETQQLLQSVLDAKKKADNEINAGVPPGWRMLVEVLKEYQGRLDNTASAYEARQQDIDRKLEAIHSSTERRLLQQSQNEKEALQSCIEYCSQAVKDASKKQRHLFEDVTADTDAFQAIVSTPEELVSARGVKAGQRAVQCLGSIPEPAFLQLTKGSAQVRRHSSATQEIQAQSAETTEPGDITQPNDNHTQPTVRSSQTNGQPLKKRLSKRRSQASWAKFRTAWSTMF